MICETLLLHIGLESRYTRESGHFSTSWYAKGWSPSTNKDPSTKISYSVWSKRGTRGNSGEHEGRRSYWDDVEHRILQTTPKELRWKGKKRLTEVRDTKENAPEQESVKDFMATEKRLWELHRFLNNRKGSLSSTYKKKTEANTKVYDLNQKTMQDLDPLAEEYEIFEETMKKETHETEVFAVAHEAMEEFDKAQKDQDRLQDELEFTCESMVTASKEFTNCWASTMLRAQTSSIQAQT